MSVHRQHTANGDISRSGHGRHPQVVGFDKAQQIFHIHARLGTHGRQRAAVIHADIGQVVNRVQQDHLRLTVHIGGYVNGRPVVNCTTWAYLPALRRGPVHQINTLLY